MDKNRWQKMTLAEQLSNIGMEVDRAIRWRQKKNEEYAVLAFRRALDLIDLTIEVIEKNHRLKELCRLREIFVDYFAGENIYKSTPTLWEKYFLPFNYLARK